MSTESTVTSGTPLELLVDVEVVVVVLLVELFVVVEVELVVVDVVFFLAVEVLVRVLVEFETAPDAVDVDDVEDPDPLPGEVDVEVLSLLKTGGIVEEWRPRVDPLMSL